ncbi:PucR family transcriptional regulator [Amycolatopsis pigmentata]|uniref:PucR family transcriptional regulator n=1 Tax=Amycolatopsis pigmentata TaxID=450801 RepID=A0ABW5FS76_9PSEU
MRRSPEEARGQAMADAFGYLAQLLCENTDKLADDIVTEIVEKVPTYSAVARASLRRSLRQHIETAARSLIVGKVPERVQDVSVAAERARSGIPIEHVLLAIRLSFQALREFVIGAATERGIEPGIQLEGVRILWEVNDLVSREYAVAHRDEDLDMARTAETRRVEFVRSLLRDGVNTPDMALHAASFGLVATARYRAFRARPAKGESAGQLLHQILSWGNAHRLAPFGAVVEGDAVGILTGEDLPVAGPTAGIGPTAELNQIHESYRAAGQVIEVGLEFGRTGPQTLESLSLHVAVASEHSVGDHLVERILAPLLAQGEFGKELVSSLDAFLAAGMNTAAAARELVIHPNTLRYRVNQVKHLSGLNLESAQEISEVWWALRRHEWKTRTRRTLESDGGG